MTNLEDIITFLMDELHLEQKLGIPHHTLKEQRQLLRKLMNIRPPKPISSSILAKQDIELQAQLHEKGVVESTKIPNISNDNRLKLWQGDITRLRIDAIVNAANSQLLGCFVPLHACVDNAIHSAAGMQLRQACFDLMKKQGHLEETGKAKITLAYNLPSKYVIHTVGPVVRGHAQSLKDEKLLESAYLSVLHTAQEHQLESIAFCCISTGEFGFPPQRAAEIAVHTVKEYLDLHPLGSVKAVVFNVFKNEDLKIYEQLFHG